MKNKAPLKVAAVVSSIALVAGHIWFNTGRTVAADELKQSVRNAKPAPAPTAVTSSAKAAGAQQTSAPQQPKRAIMSGSKSLAPMLKSDPPSK